MSRYEIEYADSDSDVRELISVEGNACDANFGDACFQAMMASNGNPCTLVLVVDGKDKRRWDLHEGDNPRFDDPDESY